MAIYFHSGCYKFPGFPPVTIYFHSVQSYIHEDPWIHKIQAGSSFLPLC